MTQTQTRPQPEKRPQPEPQRDGGGGDNDHNDGGDCGGESGDGGGRRTLFFPSHRRSMQLPVGRWSRKRNGGTRRRRKTHMRLT